MWLFFANVLIGRLTFNWVHKTLGGAIPGGVRRERALAAFLLCLDRSAYTDMVLGRILPAFLKCHGPFYQSFIEPPPARPAPIRSPPRTSFSWRLHPTNQCTGFFSNLQSSLSLWSLMKHKKDIDTRLLFLEVALFSGLFHHKLVRNHELNVMGSMKVILGFRPVVAKISRM